MSEPQRFLGKYQIIDELGRGGFATVYRARDRDLDRQVALKVLDPLLTRDPVWVARFRREAQAVARLDHPRVVTVYEIGQSEGALFIATKLIEGGSLAEYLAAAGPLPWPDVLRITGEIAEALDYAHGHGVLHRDLKPANVLLDPRNGAVLTDFGFARLVADNSLSISLSGGIVGTPAYIAPEVWEGREAGPAADTYALGCIVYELATGQQRFHGATPPAIMLAHFQPPPLPTAWPEGTPQGLTDVLRTALTRDPQARYTVAGDLVAALAALSADPLAEPYAELEATLAAGQWQQALALVDAIKARNSAYRDVAGLERRAIAGLERDARARQIADWRAVAEQALAQGNLEGAELALDQWQRLASDDGELARILALLQARRKQVECAEEPQTVVSSVQREQQEAESKEIESVGAAASPSPMADSVSIEPSFQDSSTAETSSRSPRSWVGWLAAGAALVAALLIGLQALTGLGAANPQPSETPTLPIATPPPTNTPVPSTDTPVPPTAAPTVEPKPTLGIGSTMISEIDGMEYVYVPGGEFLMGSDSNDELAQYYEKPQHPVFLEGYWIARTEVTARQYLRCVQSGACSPVEDLRGTFWWTDACTYSDVGKEDHPINCLTWDQAVAYCKWAGCRLPTEAEWEKAARGTDGRVYPWGNDILTCEKAEHAGCRGSTVPVGSNPRGSSPYGVLNMAGNVREWVADWFDAEYYTLSPQENPEGPTSGVSRVTRGGSWNDAERGLRAVYRHWSTSLVRSDLIGFRPVRSP